MFSIAKSFGLTLAATLACAAVIGGSQANAQLLNGSLPLSGVNVTQNGADLLASTTITNLNGTITNGAGAGDYAPIPLFTPYSTTTLTLANPVDFSISNATWGTFTSNSFLILTHTATFYDVEIFGTYTPGPGLVGFVATNGELRVSINQSGASLSEAITLSTPPADVPEPGSVAAVVGMGVTGSLFALRLRRRRK